MMTSEENPELLKNAGLADALRRENERLTREGLVAVRIGPRVYWISTKAASGIEAICAASGSDKPQLARLDAEDPPVYGPISPCQFWRR